MTKQKIRKLNRPYYVCDEYNHTDAVLVGKINQLVDIINRQDERIRSLEQANKKKGSKNAQGLFFIFIGGQKMNNGYKVT